MYSHQVYNSNVGLAPKIGLTVADPGLMKGSFSGDATILAVVVLTTEMGQLRAKRAI